MKPGGIRPLKKIKQGDGEARTRHEGSIAGTSENSKILNAREVFSEKE